LPGPTDSRAGGAQRGVGAESARWVINATELASREWDAELFSHKSDIVDSANHQCAMSIDPACHRYDAAQAEGFDRVLRQACADIDTIIGQMLRAASDIGNTRVMIVGDHGICVNNVVCDINQRLHDQGLLFVYADETVDMRRRLAYSRGSRQGNEVFINLQGP
jgi:predicted AlkP superfamily phosphohydrolase/phosphomutase